MDRLETPRALEKRIEQLEALRSVLGDALTDGKKADLEGRLPALIETAGAAAILGDVRAGRDVAGRNLFQLNLTLGPDDPPERILTAYHRSLAAECRRPPLGVIDTRFVRTAGEATIPLPDIHVDLDVVAPTSPAREEGQGVWALRLMRPEGAERRPVLAALSAPEHAAPCCSGVRDQGSPPWSIT
ncbi:MAG: hypothetical protein ACREXU_16635 [Gammaproteobacteria bacterium]